MSYTKQFAHADDIVNHLNTVVPALNDPLLEAKYVGFVAIAAITVYELAIRDVFVEFSSKKHKVFGTFTEAYFGRINGRIRMGEIRDNIKRFGDKYLKRFNRKMDATSNKYLKVNKRDLVTSYSNLITWRHDFAHQGTIKTNATYSEVIQAYEDGKEVIRCLAESMNR